MTLISYAGQETRYGRKQDARPAKINEQDSIDYEIDEAMAKLEHINATISHKRKELADISAQLLSHKDLLVKINQTLKIWKERKTDDKET
ncbi:MAG: hypothetical protein GY943_30480 [Chloroflexi bacterium]|nr:hypothetical protein [Chloroflexota bacterium]